MKKIRITIIVAFLVLAIFTSQCLAQSSASKLEKNKNKEYLDYIDSIYFFIQNYYVEEVDAKTLYEGAIRGMLETLKDPYSVYMDESEWRNLTDTTDGSFGGVGLSITKASKSTEDKPAYVEVANPIDDTPGAKAGIQAGDLIIKIDGVDTSTITMDEVLKLLRGPAGESVTVTIRRGKNMEFERTIVRAIIENPTVKYTMIGSTGYIRLSEFAKNSAVRFQEALDSFKAQNYDSLIIDLRNNGGGLLDTAFDIANKFIDDGIIVQTKSRINFENKTYIATKNVEVKDIPVIVLINRASASASEILSGALKDTKKAVLLGEKTYGKGSVQIPKQLIENDGFKITIAKYYSPTDTNIDKAGILPDKEVNYPEFSEEEEKAFQAIHESEEIAEYVEKHPEMTEDDISVYAKNLNKKYPLNLRTLRKLIRNESDKSKPSRVYDLDYDIQLKTALDIIKTEEYKTLLSNSKTLKEQKEEREAVKAQEENTQTQE